MSADPEQPISNSPDLHPTDLILVVIILHYVALKNVCQAFAWEDYKLAQNGSGRFLILAALPIP